MFNINQAGHIYTGGTDVYYQDGDLFRSVSIDANGTATVTLTGYYVRSTRGYLMYQTTAGKFIDITDDGWRDAGTRQYSQAEAQSLVDRMIENHKVEIGCNLLCARFSYKLTADEKKQLYDLQSRLDERNNRLATDGICTDMVTSTPAGFSSLQGYMQTFMAGGGVGIATTTAIIISAVVIASLSTAGYFAYKYLYDESAQDVRFSKDLTKKLQSRLTDDEYKQLLRETQGIVTKAKIRTMLSSSSKWLTWSLIASAAYILYQNFATSKPKKKDVRKD